MNKKRIEQVRRVAKEAFQEAGSPVDDAALDLAIEVAQDPRFQQLINQPGRMAVASVVGGCLLAAQEWDARPTEEWGEFLDRMRRELPYDLRPGFRTEMKKLVKGLPKRPSPGRNEILNTREKQKKACDLVGKYYRDGDSMRIAYEKASKEFNCSDRTISRAWKKRGSFRGKTK